MKIKIQLLFCILFVFIACEDFNTDDKLLVSLYDKELYLSEVRNSLPIDSDSIIFVERYIESWIKNQLLLTQAEMNLTDAIKDIEERISDYRSSLLIYAYQQELINQNFDTIVSNIDIANYYESNKKELELKESIFKGRFIKINKDAPNIHILKNIFRSYTFEDTEELLEYCRQFAADYHLDDTSWIYSSKFAKKIPLEITDPTYFLSSRNYYNYTIDSSQYYIHIKEYRIRGNISPLILVDNRIRKIIQNKNKLIFLKQLEEDLYNKAILDDKIKLFL